MSWPEPPGTSPPHSAPAANCCLRVIPPTDCRRGAVCRAIAPSSVWSVDGCSLPLLLAFELRWISLAFVARVRALPDSFAFVTRSRRRARARRQVRPHCGAILSVDDESFDSAGAGGGGDPSRHRTVEAWRAKPGTEPNSRTAISCPAKRMRSRCSRATPGEARNRGLSLRVGARFGCTAAQAMLGTVRVTGGVFRFLYRCTSNLASCPRDWGDPSSPGGA
jgi:hypothetical protein